MMVITFGLQFASLSRIVDGRVDTDQNNLKNYINYYVTVCGVAFGAMAYVLGKFFTSDIVWHLDEKPGNTRFNKAWGLIPELSAVFSGCMIGGKRWVVTGVVLSLVACFSLVKGIWLTQTITIKPHVSVSPQQNFTVATLHGGFNETAELFRSGYLGVFASEIIMGLKGSTILHQDNGEYIWSPWLIDSSASEIVIQDYLTMGLRPTCRLLKKSQVNVTAQTDGGFRIDIAASLHNTSDPATLYMYNGRMETDWNSTTVLSNIDSDTSPNFVVNYHVFGTTPQYDKNTTFTFNSPDTAFTNGFNAYVYGCVIEFSQYYISGQITSNVGPSLDRLNLTEKIPVVGESNETFNVYNMVYKSTLGFGDTIAYQQISGANMEVCTPIQCWMIDEIPGIYTGYNSTTDGPTSTNIYTTGWLNMSPALLEYKIAQAIGYILSPSVCTNDEIIMANNVTHDFVTETIPRYVYGGVGVQLVLVLLAIGIYLATVSNFSQGHGDDLDYLVSLIKDENEENELDSLKG
ncbi:hypothetical protein BGZ58_001738 [Dissophora ornata]|nr:hypothetical protein BGZ58_001738 [Dissophora ornata]